MPPRLLAPSLPRSLFGVALFALAALGTACTGRPAAATGGADAVGGGTVVASVRAEPRSFNRYVTRDLTGAIVSYLNQASLVRIDRRTDRLEPDLADGWELQPDRVTYRLTLRRGLTFSDGAPFSSADVVFSFDALYDARTGSPLADSLLVRGKPLVVRADGPNAVTIRFPSPFGPGLRMLDGVPILPRHRLQTAFAAGTFSKAWSLGTPPSEIAGLGPFTLQEYVPGQRLVFERNSRYWRNDAPGPARPRAAGRLVLEVVADQDAEQLRLTSGQLDFTQSEIRPADYISLKRAAAVGRVALTELGIGRDGDLFWFNLAASRRSDTRSAWLQHVDFRRAVAHAVDRDAFVNTVYLGAAVPAYGVVSPNNREWFADAPAPRFDPAAARERLASLRLVDRDGNGTLEDAKGQPARFTLLTQKGNTSLERGAAMLRDSLKPLGIQVDVVALEVGALVEHFEKGDYDAAYFRLITTDTDPALNPDFWSSAGSAHVWNPSQPSPATPWEREIDTLMAQISSLPDRDLRRKLFADVQRIMARELPAMPFAFPKLWVAMSTRVEGATPAPFRPPVLWNPSGISVRPRSS